MSKTFRCKIVTPSEAVFDGSARYVTFPAWDGQQGVLPGQSPLLTQLGIGGLRLDPEAGGSQWYLIEQGFAQIDGDTLTILTERATAAEDLDEAEADALLVEANAAAVGSGEDRQVAEARQARARGMKRLATASR